MTVEEADECHVTPWTDAEIEVFAARVLHLIGAGRRDAGHVAERCCLRDRRCEDVRYCVECAHFKRGACSNWEAAGYSKPEAVLLDVMQRCPGFLLAPSLAKAEQPQTSLDSEGTSNDDHTE